MEHKDLTQLGNTLEVKFVITSNTCGCTVKTSPEFSIGNNAIFQLRVIAYGSRDSFGTINYYNVLFIRFVKQHPDENLNYNMKFTCKAFEIEEKCFTCDDGTWRFIHENTNQLFTFNASVAVVVVPQRNSFAALHEDEELTDFELHGKDGAIRVHRAVLAAASPVLGSMLRRSWLETKEGLMKVPGTSKATLQHLKNYIYLNTVPEVGLEQLLLLASYYMMPDLEQKCVDKLVQNLTAQNYCFILMFAIKNDMKQLLSMILTRVKEGKVEIDDIISNSTGEAISHS